jgi:hypothetical protein
VFEQKTSDGGSRSGVVLSDGLLITAAEIGAMETVPDLVFLNCCHLARADTRPVAFNRLAYSIARELIEMGVRAVVAAGWAVDDSAARLFAEEFYTQILSNRPFGEAIFAARQNTYERFPSSSTWGAYQAYGDPSFVIDPQRVRSVAEPEANWCPVTHEELILKLRELRGEAATGHPPTPAQSRGLADRVEQLLKACPPTWIALPMVSFGLGEVYGELAEGYFDVACQHYLAAIGQEGSPQKDSLGGVPIRAIEQLANLEARVGEARDDEALLQLALERLQALVQRASTTRSGASRKSPKAVTALNPERAALLGSVCKRLAAVHARGLLSAPAGQEGTNLREALDQAITWYGKGGEKPFLVLNRLALEAVRDLGARPKPAAIEQARACARQARVAYRTEPDFWNAVMPADALMTERLLDHSLGAEGKPGEAALKEVKRTYAEALTHVRGTPRERDSVVKHLRLLQALLLGQGRLEQRLEGRAGRSSTRLGLVADLLQLPSADSGAEDGDSGEDVGESE